MKKIFLIFSAILLTIEIFAQSHRIKFEHISLEQGLSQSSVKSIVQDSHGFMWFATIDGLNKYDGYRIKVYEYKNNQKNSISDNVLSVVYESNEGNVKHTFWVGTAGNGLCRYNNIHDNFTTFKNDPKNQNSLSNNNITAIYGKNNFLWVGTSDGLNKLDVNQSIWKIFKTSNSKLPDNFIKCMVADNHGRLWMATRNEICFVNLENDQITIVNKPAQLLQYTINAILPESENTIWLGTDKGLVLFNIQNNLTSVYFNNLNDSKTISSNKVTTLVKDSHDILWVGTENGGLNRFNIQTGEFNSYKHEPSDPHSLSTDNILSIYQDKSGILWVGSSLGGISKWNRAAENLQLFRHNPYEAYSLSSNQIRNIYEDKTGHIWIGTVEGGLNKWDVSKNRFIHYNNDSKNPRSLSHNHVRCVLDDSKGNIWVATDGGGLNRFDSISGSFTRYMHDEKNSSSISENRVWKIFEDSKGNLWVATHGGGLNKFDPKTGKFSALRNNPTNPNSLSSDFTTTIFEDKAGNLWIGTFLGLNLFSPEKNSFVRFTYNENDSNSLSNNRVYSIVEDTEGELWIGTKGGLNKLNKSKTGFEHFGTENTDFPNNVMMGIIDDDLGNLWISTNRGISKFNKKTHKVRNYDVRDGLQSNEFLAGAFCKTKKGELFFGGINGFNAFYPSKIKDNPNIPMVVITGFRISNNDIVLDSAISEKKVIELNHNQTDLSFDFVALDYIFPEKNQYAYQLVGYDNDWQYVKFTRTAKYTNLPPKNYIFKVKGSNNDEVWNEKGTQIEVIIHPAFWQTTWFKILSFLIIVFSISLTVWLRFRAIKKYNEHLEQLVQIRTAEIVEKNVVLQQQKEEILTQNETLQQQKEEIETQRDEIEAQRDVATKQRDEITIQKKEITDSIEYAKRIQTAALVSDEFVNKILPDSFILYRPRDIVSGDFYWAAQKNNKIVITAADCTGHGVPGAFMSMLGMSFLNTIVNQHGITDSDLILNEMRTSVISSLHQIGKEMESKDGMDISLCVIDYDVNKFYFSGAYNALIIVRKDSTEAEPIKADDMPIAIYLKMDPFTKNEIDFNAGDVIYMFSDGYADQFGGVNGKKFMYKKFRELLASIAIKPMPEQKEILNETIEKWMDFPSRWDNASKYEQVDDIVIIGIRL